MVEEAREVTMEEDLREEEHVFQMLEGRTVSSTRQVCSSSSPSPPISRILAYGSQSENIFTDSLPGAGHPTVGEKAEPLS